MKLGARFFPTLDFPGEISEQSPARLRESILSWCLGLTILAASLVYGFYLWRTLQSGSPIFTGIFAVLFLGLLLLAGFPSIRYRLRAAGLLGFLFASGAVASAAGYPLTSTLYWFVAGAGMAAMFFGLRFALLAILASAGMLTAVVMLPISSPVAALEPAGFLYVIVPFVAVSFIFSVTGAFLLRGLERFITQLIAERTELKNLVSAAKGTGQNLERRLLQLRTVAEISHTASRLLDPDELISQFISLLKERFNLYYVGLFFLDEFGENAVLHAGTGEAGERMLAEHHSLPAGGTSMIGWAVAHAKARIALDSGAEAIRFNNPHLPDTRSELALPLLAGQKVIGALTIQSDKPDAFDQNDLTVLQGLADALATSLQNANLFRELQSSMQEIEALNRQYLVSAWTRQAADIVRMEHTYEMPKGSAPEGRGEFFSAPLIVRGELIGDLTMESSVEEWTAEDKRLIESVAAQTAQALENARLIQETQHQAYQEQLVSDFGSRIRETFHLDSIMRTAVRELGDRLNLAEVQVVVGWDDADQAD